MDPTQKPNENNLNIPMDPSIPEQSFSGHNVGNVYSPGVPNQNIVQKPTNEYKKDDPKNRYLIFVIVTVVVIFITGGLAIPFIPSVLFLILWLKSRKNKGDICPRSQTTTNVSVKYKKYKRSVLVIIASAIPLLILCYLAALKAYDPSGELAAGLMSLIVLVLGVTIVYLVLSIIIFVILLRFIRLLHLNIAQEPDLAPQHRAAGKSLNIFIKVLFFLSLVPFLLTGYFVGYTSIMSFVSYKDYKETKSNEATIQSQISTTNMGSSKINDLSIFKQTLLSNLNSGDKAGVISLYWHRNNPREVAEDINKMTTGVPKTILKEVYMYDSCHIDKQNNVYASFDLRPVADPNTYGNYAIMKEQKTGNFYIVTRNLDLDSTSTFGYENPFQSREFCNNIFNFRANQQQN